MNYHPPPRFVTHPVWPSALRLALLACFATFVLSGCADSCDREPPVAGNPASQSPSITITARATRGTPCAKRGALAWNADATMVLVCAEGDRKRLVWQMAGLERRITEAGEAGASCAKSGELAVDATGAVLTCVDDMPKGQNRPARGGPHGGK